MIKYLASFLAIVVFVTVVLLNRLSEFELSGYELQRSITFEHRQDILQGTLILPQKAISPPVVLLVHGDGAQDRWSDGGYIPLVKFLVSQGVAVFSWDKAGVGASKGNWLAQTMSDRADEAAFALNKLKQQPELKNSPIGFLGFSQAGWAVPRASELTKADFAVLAGAAVNWRDQGIYYMGQRLKFAGRSAAEITQAQEREAADFDRQFTEENAALPCLSRCTRQDFERRNSRADARKDISKMHTPVMILMGEDDRNADPHETASVWAKTLPAKTPRCIRLFAGTTHGLLRSAWFDYQLPSQWPLWKQGAFLLSGQHSYSPGVLNAISDWILNQKCPN
ncbi:alpha/beta hydrolase [Brenneria populi subsp. brevivirga]|uniref:alpha/beta hydrolase family protein n=1 Tax=Brenneria populi TaxID=1505588 RepID=UPI002E18E38A|nr:alpha/beta hydrolase [Brenneria populi subsp. brevivirga]